MESLIKYDVVIQDSGVGDGAVFSLLWINGMGPETIIIQEQKFVSFFS